MDANILELRNLPAEGRSGPPEARVIASGKDWIVREYTCHAGPYDRPFEEQHDGFTIAVVVEGSFIYKADGGRVLLHSGALLLGNDGRCFECGHDHSIGDRCIAFRFTPEFFAEIAATRAGTSRYKFPAATLPMTKQLMPMIVSAEALGRKPSPLSAEEGVSSVVETVVATLSGHTSSHARVRARDERRIADVLHYIEDHAAEHLDLDMLAAIAGVSKYHFLRMFRATVEMTPYQFLLAVRMRRAALRLTGSSETISSIAFETGFGDLSTFNNRFRDLFGVSPRAYRRHGGGA